MRLNKILMALSAMAIVGCSSEDFNDPSVTQAIDDSRLIQLDENFVLAGVGEVDNTTRTHWAQDGKNLVNVFLPIYTGNVAANTVLSEANLKKQAVGLCWLGNGGVGTDVYTNYEFYHFGWLKKDETKANVECNELTNGAFYKDIKVNTAVEASEENPVEANTAKFVFTDEAHEDKDFAITDLNYNSGVYKTDNKAIFGGQYIVYYPYNANFKDAGTIPAVAETNWAAAPKKLDAPELGEGTFRYSAPVTIEGGNQAADFGLKNLSTLVRLKVAPADNGAEGKKIDKIVLFSASKKLLKQANLAADKIAAGKKGAELYASTEGTKTIVANFAPYAIPAVDAEDPTTPYITVLPTTVDDLVAFVHNSTEGTWARVDLGSTEFKAGSAKALTITVASTDFTTDFIAVDQASLAASLESAREDAAENNPHTIQVIGDIQLTADLAINDGKDAFITIKGDDIIVPQDVTLTLKTKMESNIRVLGKSCCDGHNGGRLEVQGGTISNVTLEETEASKKDETNNPKLTYSAAATVAAGKTIDVKAGKVEVNAAVAHKGDIKIAKGATVTVNAAGGLNFMGSNVTNDGTIEVMKNGNFNMTNSDGGATAAAGKRMTNNGTFIHNVDAAVGTAVQSMNQNGEYRCKVDEQAELADAYQKWSACSVIEIVTGTNYNLGVAESNINYQHNGKYIDIEVNAEGTTTFDNAAKDNKEIKIGKLTVTKGNLIIDFVKANGADASAEGYKIFKRTLTVNGDMTVAAAECTTTILDSKKVNITGNLNVNKGTLTYCGPNTPEGETKQNNEEGLAVAKDINVNGAAFVAQDDALNITCANFYLKKGTVGATATFGNRTAGDAKNMVVSGTIDNPKECTFTITAAKVAGKLLAWVSCKELKVGGTFTGGIQPQVVE